MSRSSIERMVAAVVVAVAFVWAYWPTLVGLVATWNRLADYSHGFLVVPLAILIMWARRESFPGLANTLGWGGLSLVALSIVVRMGSARYYLDAADGWSIVVWTAGATWFLCGRRVLWWALPSVLILGFMVPLPFRLDHALSRPLQHAATTISCWVLQCLGQPALAENNIIHIGDQKMHVEEACSGLRIFMGIIALAYVYFVLVRRAWWQRAVLVLSIVPIALAANSTRIVITTLLFQRFPGENVHDLIHQYIGYLMIPYAALLFAGVLWYVRALTPTMYVVDAGDLARRRR